MSAIAAAMMKRLKSLGRKKRGKTTATAASVRELYKVRTKTVQKSSSTVPSGSQCSRPVFVLRWLSHAAPL